MYIPVSVKASVRFVSIDALLYVLPINWRKGARPIITNKIYLTILFDAQSKNWLDKTRLKRDNFLQLNYEGIDKTFSIL